MHTAAIRPLEPVIARDSRPFGSGSAHVMRCLEWFYPSVTAGTVRTLAGKKLNMNFGDSSARDRLKEISILGPLPCKEGEGNSECLFLPAPHDILIFKREKQIFWCSLRPERLADGEGCTLPSGLAPVTVKEEVKPERGPAFWSVSTMTRWLTKGGESLKIPSRDENSPDFLFPLEIDERTHVKIDPALGAAEEQRLFSSQALCFPHDLSMAVKLECKDDKINAELKNLAHIHQIGGEHRLAFFRESREDLWSCPPEVAGALKGARKIRMIVATPALFSHGWLPGWLDSNTFEGTPPGVPGLRVKLTGACVDRWKPISGWSLEPLASTGKAGPKAIRRLVPAGSVYFFEVKEGEAGILSDIWLKPVCDSGQDCRDGFGLSLWGTW